MFKFFKLRNWAYILDIDVRRIASMLTLASWASRFKEEMRKDERKISVLVLLQLFKSPVVNLVKECGP